eukprot:15455787-Alexandrium_andersonii.AAC.1
MLLADGVQLHKAVQQVLDNCPVQAVGGAGALEAQAAEIRRREEADLLEASDRAMRAAEERALQEQGELMGGGDGLSHEPYQEGCVPSTPSPAVEARLGSPA